MSRGERLLLLLTGGIAAGAVLLQGWLTWGYCAARDMSVAATLSKLFSYFTVLTNILLAAGCLWPGLAPSSPGGRFFRRPGVRTALLLYIGTVGAVYVAVLQSQWNPQDWQRVADAALHYITPLLYFFYWMRFGRRGFIPWTSSLRWLLYPLVYLLYSLIRARFTGDYPYPFIDLRINSPLHVTLNVLLLSGIFLLMSVTLIYFSRERKSGGDVRTS